ncbi:TfoX/Sxy family protein [Phytoactinopolyspora alkaliphila]
MVNRRNALAARIRESLTTQRSFREVRMFGGLAFMVNERMILSVMGDGSLLIRAAPERADELLTADGARPADMGTGRNMGKGWIAIDDAAVATQEDLEFWVGVTLEYAGRERG